MEGYETLTAGLAVFFVAHLIAGIYEARARMVAMLGTNMYRLLHSAFAILGLTLIVIGYGGRPLEAFWEPPAWGMLAPKVIMPVALVLLAGSFFSRASIQRVTRHPMLWSVLLWALAHLLANGDKGSVMMFGGFLVYAILAQWLGDRKKRLRDPQGWAALRHRTSAVPLVALLAGRTAGGSADKGLLALAVGLLLYGALLYLHPYISGVAIL